MPSAPARKLPPKKQAVIAAGQSVAILTESLSQLKVSSFYEAFSVNQTYSFTISTDEEQDDSMQLSSLVSIFGLELMTFVVLLLLLDLVWLFKD
jgi:hypothetical protein